MYFSWNSTQAKNAFSDTRKEEGANMFMHKVDNLSTLSVHARKTVPLLYQLEDCLWNLR